MPITAEQVRALRERSGAPIMDCKRALLESEGDTDRAVDLLRRWGRAQADRDRTRETKEGRIHAYVHHDGRKGVLVEVGCETDFVARSAEFEQFLRDLGLHITARAPKVVSREDLPSEVVAKEREIYRQGLEGKPPEVAERILDGQMKKFFAEAALLDQAFVKDESKTVGEMLADLVAKVRENVVVKRFARFEIAR